MSTQLYKIVFNKSSFELNDDYERLSEYEKEIISSMPVDAFFDYDCDDDYTCFLITSIETVKSYVSILNNNLIKHKVHNISNKVINNEINLEKEIKDSIEPTYKIKFNIFIDGVNEWILEHLDIDTVLDRINQVGGMNNLRQVEKEFLKNYK
jgi:hypothetical protein